MRTETIKALLLALVAAASLAAFAAAPAARAEAIEYGIESVAASETDSQAGAHPDFTTTIVLKQQTEGEKFGRSPNVANGYAKDVIIEAPPGLIGNPNNVAKCTAVAFIGNNCPLDSEIGQTNLRLEGFQSGGYSTPVFMMEPPNRNVVARFGFAALIVPVVVELSVRSDGDYGVTASVLDANPSFGLLSAETTLWGVPADPSHDPKRQFEYEAFLCNGSGIPCLAPGEKRESGLPIKPFMSNPTSCRPLGVGFTTDSYEAPGVFSTASATMPDTTGCEAVRFNPTLTVTPTSHEAGAATGLDVSLRIPQNEAFDGLATSQLRDATVTLPEGMTANAAAADGLEGCSAAQVGFKADTPSDCPNGAKLGTATFVSPALPEPLQGSIYLRTPEPGHLFRFWLVADDLGVQLKLPAEASLDPQTGQLTTTVLESPQLPAQEVQLHLKGGPRAPLKNPEACGTYQTRYELTPWSGNPATVGDAPMTIDEGCGTGGFSPKLSAGAANPLGGGYSPFVFDVSREDGEQNVASLDLTLPRGETAKLAGVPLCPEVDASPGNCPAASQIGSVSAAVGAGTLPLWVPQPGKALTAVYLAGPYRGAPYSIVAKVPAQAGPFDLGVVTVRSAVSIDPETAQVTVGSDPLPQILQGIRIDYRRLHVDVDRSGFSLNPTNCDAMAVRSRLTSAQGRTAVPSSRFQVGSCGDLGLKPKLSMRLRGKTNRGAHPRFQATLTARPGDANIARASVALPRSEFLDQAHIKTVCTRVQFAAGQCPAGSVYGRARATTPLLDQPLEGPVYLRSSSHKLPDLVAALKGVNGIEIDLVGRIDSIHGGIRTTFEAVPDAPVGKFTLTMQGGKKGLLVNSTNICRSTNRATVKLNGQNGKLYDFEPALKGSCGKGGR